MEHKRLCVVIEDVPKTCVCEKQYILEHQLPRLRRLLAEFQREYFEEIDHICVGKLPF